MNIIKFSCNFNNKLYAPFFSTIRVANKKYSNGSQHLIERTGAIVTQVYHVDIQLHQITLAMSLADTGHPLEYLKGLLKRFYGQNHDELTYRFIIFQNPSGNQKLDYNFHVTPEPLTRDTSIKIGDDDAYVLIASDVPFNKLHPMISYLALGLSQNQAMRVVNPAFISFIKLISSNAS